MEEKERGGEEKEREGRDREKGWKGVVVEIFEVLLEEEGLL